MTLRDESYLPLDSNESGKTRLTSVSLRTVGSCVLIWLALFVSAVSVTVADEPVSSDQINEWIAQLEDDEFITRETAMQELIKSGSRAIEPLSRVLQSASPETSNRGVHVLQQLIRNPSDLVQDQAFASLEELAAHPNPSVARRASLAMSSSAELLSHRAVAELSRLGARFSQSPFQFFGNIGQPQQLSLEIGEGWTGSDEDLRHLRRLFLVVEATLSGPRVTDKWLESLADIPNLIRLRISRGSITRRGISNLKKARNLSQLSLTRMQISDDVVEELQGLRAVQKLDIFGTRISKVAAERMREAMPHITLDFRPVFLGVTSQPMGMSCLLTSVEPETPAAIAGMKAGDVITKFNGTPVLDFETLRTLIALHQPGDKVDVEVLRNSDILKLKVHFE